MNLPPPDGDEADPLTGHVEGVADGESPEVLCRRAAMQLLVRREHSVRELAHKLRQRGHAAQVIGPVLEALVAEDYLNEVRYAEVIARTRAAAGYGPRRLRAELASQGLDEAAIEAGIAAAEVDWEAVLDRLLARRYPGPVSSPAERLRRQRYLLNRGFPADAVHRRLRQD